MEYINDELWFAGLDSISNPGRLSQGQYQWAQNITNRGGLVSTRQGFAQVLSKLDQKPRGLILFQAKTSGSNPYLVAAIGHFIYAIPINADGTITAELDSCKVTEISFTDDRPRGVQFEICVQAQETDVNGNVKLLDTPRFVLMMQDGYKQPAYLYYDGNVRKAGHVVANATHPVTPIGDYMKWCGDRLWVVKDNKLHASDLLTPLQFEEEKNTATGGWFYLPSHATGMSVTHDYKSLMVFTDQTTSAFQAGIEDRNLWKDTQDFQRVLFPNIGCTSHRTIINQYGLTWWMSHDGLMALDNALQTNRTSRIQVKDNQMARSKEGVSWGGGGGCAGTWGNWLFFSMPSGSNYNQHTWVMDEAPVETQETPGIWASNWTGVRPEQWVTGDVHGVQRCFCISNDPVPFGTGRQTTIWEAFIGQRMDVPRDKDTGGHKGPQRAKDIGCAWESRFMGLNPNQWVKFRYVELELAEIIGNVHLQVYYCGRKTSYKKILDKKLTATVSPAVDEVFDPDSLINVWTPQYRTVRSETDSHDLEDEDSEVQTPYLRQLDKEFSLLVTWTGQMSISAVHMCVDPQADYLEGVVEKDELTIRRITAEGEGEITNTPAPENTFNQAFTSRYLAPLRPRWIEFPQYDSATANGVFFVDVITAVQPPAGYPDNTFPKIISLTTETSGAEIRWSVNGPMPSDHTGTIYNDTHKPSILLNDNLNARAFKTGYLPSVPLTGRYTKAIAAAPYFTPLAGEYPIEDYAIDRCTFATDASGLITVLKPHGLNVNGLVMFSTLGVLPASIQPNTWYYVISKDATKICISATRGGTKILFATAGSSWHYIYSSLPALDTKTVWITTPTAGMQLRYTTDGTTPRHTPAHGITIANSSGSVEVAPNQFLKAIAFDPANHWTDSVLTSGQFKVKPKCLTPTLDKPSGQYAVFPINVVMTSPTAGSTLHFTLNDADLTHGWNSNTPHTVAIHQDDTLRVFGQKAGSIRSDVVTATYTLLPEAVATPNINPHGGIYPQGNMTVHFRCSTEGATMKFTDRHVNEPVNTPTHTNGITAHDGDPYTFHVGYRVISVIAFKAGMTDSAIKIETYTKD